MDLQNFPGGSGSPVINRPENVSITGTKFNQSCNLIGILHAFMHFPGEKENIGIALANPVDYIKETVEKNFSLRNPQKNEIKEA